MEFRAPTSIDRSQRPRKPPAKSSATETFNMDSLESLFSLRGRIGLVTGASSGLGVECAKALAIAGADVVIAARRADRLETLAHEIRSEYGVRALPLQADITIEADLERIISRTIA